MTQLQHSGWRLASPQARQAKSLLQLEAVIPPASALGQQSTVKDVNSHVVVLSSWLRKIKEVLESDLSELESQSTSFVSCERA